MEGEPSNASSVEHEWPHRSRYFDPVTMDAAHLQTMLKNLCYDDHGELGYLEAKAGSSNRYESNVNLDSDNSRISFMERLNDQETSVKICIFLNDTGLIVNRPPVDVRPGICLRKDKWEFLLGALDIHPHFIEQFHNKFIGGYTTFTTFEQHGEPEAFHVLIRVPSAGHLEGACYVRFNLRSKKGVTMLVISNRIEEHSKSLEALVAQDLWGGHRFAVLVHIFREWSDFIRKWMGYYGYRMAIFELETGRGSLALNNPNAPIAPNQPRIKEMYWILGNFRICNMAVFAQAELGSFLEIAYANFLSLQNRKSPWLHEIRVEDQGVAEALHHYQVLMDWQRKTMNNVGLMRAQAQAEAVEAILLEQRNDNTFKISQEAKEISRQSKEIAEATQKDSQSMRTIAGLSMIYLPPTFVATLCSTIFIKMKTDGSGIIFESGFWLFWVATCCLWLATGIGWAFISPPSWMRPSNWSKLKAEPKDQEVPQPKAHQE